jgi:hypothetical protein
MARDGEEEMEEDLCSCSPSAEDDGGGRKPAVGGAWAAGSGPAVLQ